jgi:hypothetical protein
VSDDVTLSPSRADLRATVRAELDVPGETRRQLSVFLLWLACLACAVAVAVARRPRGEEAALDAHTRERLAIAAGLGLGLPSLLTFWITHRRRRGGPHARGIVVDVTSAGELRLWGRGYGQRVPLDGADVSERLVDVYSGRLGAWRQRRLVVRARRAIPGMPGELHVATPATEADEALGLALVGGEGDCVELSREDYLSVLAAVHQFLVPGSPS